MNSCYILILYKNGKYKIVPFKKIQRSNLIKEIINNEIRTIFIPLYDNPNTYIPIKPNKLYNFKKAQVSIIYQSFIYDMEDQIGTSFPLQEYKAECNNIIEFINALYNCYKFRGTSIFIDCNTQPNCGNSISPVMVIRRINIKFFSESNTLIEEIDSGIMKDLEDYSPKKFLKTPAPYICEDRMNCLKDILYIPSIDDNEKLPRGIYLNDDNEYWNIIKRPGKELQNDDNFLYKIDDFQVYYMMPYKLYLQLISFKKFEIDLVSAPIATEYDTDYLTSVDKNEIPSEVEKEEAFDAYIDGDIFNILNISITIKDVDIFLTTLIFFQTIMNYIKYFSIYCYANESAIIKMRTFVIFGRCYNCGEIQDKIILTEPELYYDKIFYTFQKMIIGG